LNVGAHRLATRAAVELADHDHRIDDATHVVHGRIRNDVDDAGLRIDLHLGDVAAVRPRRSVDGAHRDQLDAPLWLLACEIEQADRAVGARDAETSVGVFEIVPYGGAGEDAGGVAKEFEWMTPLARDINRPFSMGLVQNLGYPDAWREALQLAENAAALHARVVPQVAVRSVGILMGFGIAINPLSIYPAAGDLVALPREQAIAHLRDPAVRARLLESVADHSGVILGGMATLDHVFPLEREGVLSYETTPERSVTALAAQRGVRPLELMLDQIIANEGRGFFIVPLFNPDLEAAAAMLQHPLTTIGLGDSGAHTTQTSDSGYATFALAYWVRERRLMPIERMVHKLTSELASMWGIVDRGVLRRGAFADVNVIDLGRLDLRLPEVRHDLPTGAAHLFQAAKGYAATLVNGQILMRDGVHTGAHPGRVLRNRLAESRDESL
jgi:N-acyl-D-aspartate/D-glutamate deacylase